MDFGLPVSWIAVDKSELGLELASPRARRVCRSTAPGSKFVKLHQLLLCEGVMRQPQVCKHQVCDHCGGRFGMVTHRWWGNKFCKRTCKDAYLHEVLLDRNIIRRWVSLPSRRILSNSSPRLTAFSDATLIQSYQNFATRFEPLVRSTSPLTGLRIAARPVKS
jgi:hypothetical protein